MGTDIHYSCYKDKKVLDVDINIRRNYLLFAVLNNVRNRWGLTPIVGSRKIPDEVRDFYIFESIYYHSKSCLTSTEILKWFETPHTITNSGIVSKEEFLDWDGHTPFTSYSQGLGGPNIVMHDTEENEQINLDSISDVTHLRVYWKESINLQLESFRSQIEKLHDIHGEFLFCFGFDS